LGDATNRELERLSPARVRDKQAGRELPDIQTGFDVEVSDTLLWKGSNRDADILKALFAAVGGDDDLRHPSVVRSSSLPLSGLGRCRRFCRLRVRGCSV